MKKIFWMVVIAALSFGTFAQENKCQDMVTEYTYCVVKKNGKMYLKRDGVKHDEDVKLANGNIIRAEGVIETKDRFIIIEPNQCIRVFGRVTDTKEELVTRVEELVTLNE